MTLIIVVLLTTENLCHDQGNSSALLASKEYTLSDALPTVLEEHSYAGYYHSQQSTVRYLSPQKQFNYLNSQEGVIHMLLFEEFEANSSEIMSLALYDPVYHDLNAVAV